MIFDEFNDLKYDNNDEEFLNEYVVAYSKYLLSTNFDLVKDKMADLARRGHVRSLAKYLFKLSPEKWDEDLKQMGYAIKNKKGEKTPQEWEVVASIEVHQPLRDCHFENINNIRQLRTEICKAGEDFYYADEAHKKGLIKTDVYNQKKIDCMRLTELYARQPYMQALKKVQEGYYSAFVQEGNVIDGVGFLEYTIDPDDFYLDEDNLKQYSNGELYSNLNIAQTLINNFDSYKKNDDVPYDAFFGYGFASTLFGKNEKQRHKGVKALNIISHLDAYEDVKKQSRENMPKEK